MTIAVAGEDSLFSLFWSIQPPCEIDEAILFDMTDKRTVAWVISTVLRQACTRSAVGGNNVSPERNVLRNRPGRVMTRIVLTVHRLANFPSTRPRKSLKQLFVRLQLQNKLKGKINNGREGFRPQQIQLIQLNRTESLPYDSDKIRFIDATFPLCQDWRRDSFSK
jgi:hypothetical protein